MVWSFAYCVFHCEVLCIAIMWRNNIVYVYPHALGIQLVSRDLSL